MLRSFRAHLFLKTQIFGLTHESRIFCSRIDPLTTQNYETLSFRIHQIEKTVILTCLFLLSDKRFVRSSQTLLNLRVSGGVRALITQNY